MDSVARVLADSRSGPARGAPRVADEDWRSPDEDKDVEVDNVATSAKDDDVTDDDK
ncbi:MAG: hypothetical protein LC804_19575 [Acidobacteria bacterium]|nr:hypothetical protein [Acidobacteriota bacterium]